MIGFFSFVLDRARYQEAMSRHHPGLLVAFYMFATCPRLFVRKALQRLKENGTKSLWKLLRSPSNSDEIHASEGSRDLLDSQIPLVGLIAVVPNMQGQGVGTEMLKFCFQRAIELGYKEIRATIIRGNTKSIGLFKKLGFVVTHEGQQNVFYRKTLTSGALNARKV
jgi:GNAT superfamily N-acetyltransferase